MNEKLLEFCKKFIDDNDIGCSGGIYQSDRVILGAYEFIEGVCEIVGYKKFSEGDGE